MPEFPAQVLDSLRQPLEDGAVVISRANRHVRYPARFQLIAAMNPCRCGGGPGDGACRRGPSCARQYQSRISGPFFDRIDLFYDTPPVTAMDLALPAPTEGTAEAARRVAAARNIQTERYQDHHPDEGRRAINADASARRLVDIASPDEAASALLSDAAAKLALSARAYHRVLKVARTIADLDGAGGVRRVHVAEALSYRRRVADEQGALEPKLAH
nr:ATP-binding protein [Henriciella sp.]